MKLFERRHGDDKDLPTGWIGVRVPQEIATKLSKLDVPGERESAQDLHVTMVYLQEETSQQFADALKATYDFINKTKGFEVKTKKVICFDKGEDGYPIVCEVEHGRIADVQDELCKHLDENGVSYSKKWPTYRPHICLSYSDKKIKDFGFEQCEWKVNQLELWYGHNGSNIKSVVNLQESHIKSQLIHSIVKESLFGDTTDTSPKFFGTKEQISVLRNTIIETRKFMSLIDGNDSTISQAMEQLHKKHKAALQFKRTFGIDWLY